MTEINGTKFEFHLKNVDPSVDEDAVQRSFDEAMQAALAEAGEQPGIETKAELEGGFFGAGEIVVALYVLHALKGAGIIVGTGVLTAAGKSFYEKVLEPQLLSRNLLPSKFKVVSEKPKPEPKPEPEPETPQSK